MISVVVRAKADKVPQPYNMLARVATRFFDAFAPYICGLEAVKGHEQVVRLWIDTETDQLPGLLDMLSAFINPWTGGRADANVEVVADDYAVYGIPRLWKSGE